MKRELNKKKRGIFYIAIDCFSDQPEKLFSIEAALRGVVVVRCEMEYVYNRLVYHGYHRQFREVPLDEITPTYDVIMQSKKNDDGSVTWRRIKFREVKYGR